MERDLIELESRGWHALATRPQAAADFYNEVLDNDVVMLLPGGLRLHGRSAAVDAMSGQPWASFELSDVRCLKPSPDIGIVVYSATALREGSAEYRALISSTYVRRDSGWRLVFHQQTPMS